MPDVAYPDTVPIKSVFSFVMEAPTIDGVAIDLTLSGTQVSLILRPYGTNTETELTATIHPLTNTASVAVTNAQFPAQAQWQRRWRYQLPGSPAIDVRSQNWIRFWAV